MEPIDGAKEAIGRLIAEVQKSEEATRHPYDVLFPPRTSLLAAERRDGRVRLVFSAYLGWRGWTPESAGELRAALHEALGDSIGDGESLELFVRYGEGMDAPFEDHVTSPEAIRLRHKAREVPGPELTEPIVKRSSYAGPAREKGLVGRHLVIGPSHGWTWHKENRWQFQRCRLNTTIEDLFTPSFINPFLLPMLENAGAVVFSVRERDVQTAEVIVDNDGTDEKSSFLLSGTWSHANATGWNGGVPAALDEWTEPFRLGSALETKAGSDAQAQYVPYIPRDGRYAVYVSWAMARSNASSVPVTVRHAGGETVFRVNQKAAGNTWVFLGFFEFVQGADEDQGSVIFSAKDASGGNTVTVDAVKFGGGMGNAAPGGKTSGYPRHAEAARYWLQYAGAPADAIYRRDTSEGHFGPEYIRDYISRSEWPNYLMGAPSGPSGGWRESNGLNVPVDLYLSWHTDAGVDHEGLVGTHLIYSTPDSGGDLNYPDGRSRWLNRDFATLLDDEIVRTARENYTSTWQRRQLQNRPLAETTRANTPNALIELLSHQNFNDMKYGLDPRFKFDMARSVYKAILRFLAYSEGFEPTIQPLAPTHLAARHIGNGEIELTWREQPDPLEPTAAADVYIVYRSEDGRSFDNGTVVEGMKTVFAIPEGKAMYFRVTAANSGGESFPSRVAGARWIANKKPILIVDGFDRVSGPGAIEGERFAGFDRDIDRGVGFAFNYGLTGDVYDYDRKSPWKDDLAAPGWGASDNDFEDRLELGNTFNHVARHGEAASGAGLAFDSSLSEAYTDGTIEGEWAMIDWIGGLQRTTPPPAGMPGIGNPDRMTADFEVLPEDARKRLEEYLENGGKLLLSGAYVGEDLSRSQSASPQSREFAREVLGMAEVESRSGINSIRPVEGAESWAGVGGFRFGETLDAPVNMLPRVMEVPSAEAFTPSGADWRAVLLYANTERAAALASDQVLVMGFPIETVLPFDRQTAILQSAKEHFGLE